MPTPLAKTRQGDRTTREQAPGRRILICLGDLADTRFGDIYPDLETVPIGPECDMSKRVSRET